jgi:hypothetical protein
MTRTTVSRGRVVLGAMAAEICGAGTLDPALITIA